MYSTKSLKCHQPRPHPKQATKHTFNDEKIDIFWGEIIGIIGIFGRKVHYMQYFAERGMA